MARRIVTERDLRLLGYPSKEQTLALVAYLSLCNAFGKVTTEEMPTRHERLPIEATRWVGQIMAVAGRGHRAMTAQEQTVVADRKRKVAVRRSRDGLTT